MKIAVLSDTHNQIDRVRRVLDLVRGRDIDVVLHCGDIEDAPVVGLFRGFAAHFVFGNCDADRAGLADAMRQAGVTLHENYGHLEIDGKQIAFVHGDRPAVLHELQQAACYDYLFHGHTHVRADRLLGPTRVVNPGALHRAAVKTFLVLDPATGEAETVEVA
jgi:putative phosphoesterase